MPQVLRKAAEHCRDDEDADQDWCHANLPRILNDFNRVIGVEEDIPSIRR